MPIYDDTHKGSPLKQSKEQTWTELAGDTWARPETKEVVAISAAVGAMAIGLSFGGNKLEIIANTERNISGLVESGLVKAAKSLGREASTQLKSPVLVSSAEKAIANAKVLAESERPATAIADLKSTPGELHMAAASKGSVDLHSRTAIITETVPPPLPEVPAKPAILSPDRNQIGSIMDKPDNVIRLTDRLYADTAKWPNMAPLEKRAVSAADKLEASIERLTKKLSAKGISIDPMEMSEKQLTHLQQMPGLESTARTLQTFMDRRNQSYASFSELRDERIKAAKLWTGTVNKFSRSHGLPSAKIEFNSDPENYGSYGNRLITIENDLVTYRPEHIKAVSTGIHEYTHHDQDFLAVCRFADRMNLGRTASKDELDALSYFMQGRVSDRNLARYLTIRDGRNLSANAEERAEKLIDSQITFRAIMPKSQIQEHNATYDMFAQEPTKDIIRSLYGTDGARLSAHLSTESFDSSRTHNLLAEFAPAHARIEKPWSDAYTRKIRASLDDYIQRGRMLMQDKQRIFDHAYAASFHENEAFGNGTIALEHLLRR